jgi:hypothetical protein
MARSYDTGVGNGIETTFPFSFAGEGYGYISEDNIVVEVDLVETIAFELTGPNQITFDVAPADGAAIRIRRVMDKETIYALFDRGNDFTKGKVNNNLLQMLYTLHEFLDGFTEAEVAAVRDLVMGGFRITGLGDGIDPQDAVTVAQVEAAGASATEAAASATAAEIAQTAAELAETHAETAETNAGASAVEAAADAVDTAADLVATNQDTIDTAADVLATAADLVATNQDTIDTAADVVSAAASEANAATSAAEAAASAAALVDVDDMLALVGVTGQADGSTAGMSGFFVTFPEQEFKGGGKFVWQTSLSKSLANGIVIIDPDNTGGFDGTTSTLVAYFNAQGSGEGSGCWVRSESYLIDPYWAGAIGDGVADDFTAVSVSDTLGSIILKDGTFRIGSNLTIANSVVYGRNSEFSVNTGVTVTLSSGYGLDPFNRNVGVGTLNLPDTNVALGDQNLRVNTSGSRNTAIGATTLRKNTTGSNNTGLGVAALNRNVDGGFNVSLGSDTLQHNSSGSYNTAVGRTALLENTTGGSNVAVGSLACTTQNASRNTAIGAEALHGYNDLEMLDDPGFDDIAAQWTTSAGTFPAGGWAVGSGKVLKNADGTAALWDMGGNAPILAAIGLNYTVEYTIEDLTVGSVTASFGGISDTARSSNGTYSFNINAATTTARLAFTPTNTSRFSISAASKLMTSNIGGDSNTAIGIQANYFRATGTHNTAIGETSLLNNYLGSGNVALGFNAGKWHTGDDELFIDNQDRVNEAAEKLKALIWGQFDSDEGDQLLRVNANFGINRTPTPVADRGIAEIGGLTTTALAHYINDVPTFVTQVGAADTSIQNKGSGHTKFWTSTTLALQINGSTNIVENKVGTLSPKYSVTAMQTAPSSAGDTGTAGEIRFTADYIYTCVATNTWKRVALATW